MRLIAAPASENGSSGRRSELATMFLRPEVARLELITLDQRYSRSSFRVPMGVSQVWLTILPFSGRRTREHSDRRAGPTATAGWAASVQYLWRGRPFAPRTGPLGPIIEMQNHLPVDHERVE